MSAAGNVLDPTGIRISTNNGVGPAVAWNGTNFLVVWEDFRPSAPAPDIYGARVSAAGTVLEPTGIPIAAVDAERAPAVAWDGTNFLVVWQDNNSNSYDIFGARVSAAGSVLDPAGIAISTAASYQFAPAVAWNGSNFLVVWMDLRFGIDFDVYGARVSTAGNVLDPAGLPISTAADAQLVPAVASWSDNFLVVWQQGRPGTNSDIYGAGVGGDGTVAQPAGIPISTAPGDQESPDLAVRYHFLVAWRDRRSGTNYDVYATRVRPKGAVEDSNGVLVAGAATDEGAPAVTGGPGATWRVTYDRFVPESPYGANRVLLRSVSPK